MSATTSRPLPECWGHRGVRPPRPLLPATHLESRPPPPGQRTPSPASKAQSKTAPTASSLVRRSSALVVLSSSYVFPDIHVSKDDPTRDVPRPGPIPNNRQQRSAHSPPRVNSANPPQASSASEIGMAQMASSISAHFESLSRVSRPLQRQLLYS